jgi:SAM-dependent methyltransferase
MWPIDVLDQLTRLPYRELRHLPPNRLRIRIGVGNRILFNGVQFRLFAVIAVNYWMAAFEKNLVTATSNILDLGCGCGRFALVLRDFDHLGYRFRGVYTGVDIDAEMIDWCRSHFPGPQFRFIHTNRYSKVYNPSGATDARLSLPIEADSQDFVFSVSLLTHVLEAELLAYLRESYRVLRPGQRMEMSVFCHDAMKDVLGTRWTFAHPVGNALVESPDLPEAAVAYPKEYLLDQCRATGFREAMIRELPVQSVLCCTK